ncbi:Lon protease family protein [Fonticella tunisiensis]|uniref:endopeptidase La n=1 Tax=Fonticella tunisiensis TaxID=1096341 RepID=A0A4V6Q2Z6_9CLOT|nr:ATP-binding protein [Fonticella tunisiensis]TDT61869.1 lon-related putative ATP-dependent protease [Fonticella tunisiensis]
MSDYRELTLEDLKFDLKLHKSFESTLEIAPYNDIIGQERAVKALEMGLIINKFGYNIFVAGRKGTGKRSYIADKLKEYAKDYNVPDDWCYVYNFNDPFTPLAVSLHAGTAEEFKNDLENFIDSLFEKVPKVFSDELYERERSSIIDKYQKEILHLADKLFDESKERGFNVKSTGEGFAFIPLKDGEEMSEKQYNELSEEEKERINLLASDLKLLALETMRKTKSLKKEMADELKNLDNKMSIMLMEKEIEYLKDKYGYNKKIIEYINAVEQDITDNIDAFMDYENQYEKYDENFFKRYYVNIMVCNKGLKGAPVVFEENPEYHNLLGIVEYENKSGTLVTDFTMIKPGSLHRANGGFLVIDALQLLKTYRGWEALKKALRSRNISIENLKNQFEIIPLATLKPEDIPLDIKVIVYGSNYLYYLLYNYDDDFKELFKIKVNFDDEIENTSDNIGKLLGFLSNYCIKNEILPITREGVIELLRYSARLSQSKKHFDSSLKEIVDIIEQAGPIAEWENSRFIDGSHVKSAIELREKRHSMIRDKILDMYRDNKYIVNLSGYRIGQINGLSVIDYGDFAFGKQNRITVTTFAGRDGVINIERETDMSGNIHSKGIMILSGYIGERFGQNMPLSFSASICFEQLYGEIDGDSASAAELIALMSSLGDIPIKQSIAVTGSVNQKGEIQPVGGLIEKVEGFYEICRIFGLNGSHGVIIPYSNIDELVLKDEVLEAVDKKLFHVYAVKTIDDCFEILCQDLYRKGNRKNTMDYVDEAIRAKLQKYNSVFNERGKK